MAFALRATSTAVLSMGLAVGLVAGPAIAAPAIAAPAIAASAVVGDQYFVDCSAAASGNGRSTQSPFNSLDSVNALLLTPGATVSLKRGSSCRGTLAPQGSGTAESPISIGAYGPGSARPVIDGNGATDTVLLKNIQGIEIRDLEVTNAKLPASKRRGVFVNLENFGTASHVVVQNLYVHDIAGDDSKDTNGSGGILASVTGTAKPSNFDDLRILGNTVDTVDRSGISAVASVWAERPAVGSSTISYPWTPSTGVVISGNTVKNTGGDGIVAQTAKNALIERNTVAGVQKRSAGYNAGIWPWNSDGTVFRYNEASGGQTTRDGMAFDVDQGTDGTVFEYNYSHDNAGGFFLLCNATGVVKNAVIRYNISQNDSYRGFENCSGGIESASIYNNTIYIGPGISQTVINENNGNARNVVFRNNLVLKEGSGSASFKLASGSKYVLGNNAVFNVASVPANPGGIGADPRLMGRGTGSSIQALDGYRLHDSSPALAAGAVIPDNGGQDAFGNPVAADTAPNIGADNGAGVAGPAPAPVLANSAPSLANPGFESGSLSPWAASRASISSAARSGAYALSLNATASKFATAEQTVSGMTPGMKYRLTAWIASDGQPTVLGMKNNGNQQSSSSSSTGWTQVSVDFTANGSSATAFCYRPTAGTARCDDFSISPL